MYKPTSQIFLAVFVFLTIATMLSAAQYEFPDLAGDDNFVNFKDFVVLAENWQKTGSGLAGDFDESNTVDLDDLAYLSYYWLTGHWECEKIDIDDSGRIDFGDFVKLADCWLSIPGNVHYNSKCDFDDSNMVDIYDLRAFCDCWLKGETPQDIWEKFKAALAADNINEAVFYFADFVADDYRAIFNENIDKIPGLAADMGNLSFEYRDKDITVYELSNTAGTNFYPIVFTLDDNGQWKIAVF